jgi:hypothetical protein
MLEKNDFGWIPVPLLGPLQSLADFYEYLLNSPSFNMAIRLHWKGVIRGRAVGPKIIHSPLT